MLLVGDGTVQLLRLPVEGDSRAWTLATWRAVIRGEPVRNEVEARAVASAEPGLSDIRLVNADDVDAELPRRVLLPTGCGVADGINGYTLAQRDGGPVLERVQASLLRGHHQQTIGWIRCAAGLGEIHVEP